MRLLRYLGGKSLLAALSMLCFGLMTNASYAGWHELTQSERNLRIISGTISYNGQYLGGQTWGGGNLGECKVFLQKVVYDVSTNAGTPVGTVYLPTNNAAPNEYFWGSSQANSGSYYVLSKGALPLSNWQPGMIVQMRTRMRNGLYSPHTAVIISNNGSSISFAESNYSATYTAGTHTNTYTDFRNLLEGGYYSTRYTVYEIH